MRILYHHRTRATDAQKVHILEMVSAFRELGHQVTIASLVDTENSNQRPEDEAKDAGWKKVARKIPFASESVQLAYNLFAIPWLLWQLRRSRAEIIYERYSLLNFAGVVAAWMTRKPIAIEVNSPLALELDREGEIRARRLAFWLERKICNASSVVVVVSSVLRRIMIENGVRESKLFLLPNCVNMRRFEVSPENRMSPESLRIGGRIVIGFAGWFRPWHGLELLIDAFSSAGLQEKAVLLLVGDGPAMPDLRARCKSAGMEGSVVFGGPATHEQIPRYLDLMDVAVQAAANEYCCPMKIIEYMALGKPIVAPRQENIEELLEDGRNALLFTPGSIDSLRETLVRIVTEPETRSRLGSESRNTIFKRRLLWTANAERVIERLLPARADTPECGVSQPTATGAAQPRS